MSQRCLKREHPSALDMRFRTRRQLRGEFSAQRLRRMNAGCLTPAGKLPDAAALSVASFNTSTTPPNRALREKQSIARSCACVVAAASALLASSYGPPPRRGPANLIAWRRQCAAGVGSRRSGFTGGAGPSRTSCSPPRYMKRATALPSTDYGSRRRSSYGQQLFGVGSDQAAPAIAGGVKSLRRSWRVALPGARVAAQCARKKR